MEILHHTDGTNERVIRACVELAVSEAPSMVGHHIAFDSPLLPLAEVEVQILLTEYLQVIGQLVMQEFDGQLVELRAGVIVAVDTTTEEPCLAGFIQYKPRFLVNGVATIGYAAVAKEYRGKGVFAQLMGELRDVYPVLGLDCPLELVPMYEKMGFTADIAQNAHVGMSLGKLEGQHWTLDQEYLEGHKLYQKVKEQLRDKLGKGTRDAYAKRDRDTQERVKEVKALLADRHARRPA